MPVLARMPAVVALALALLLPERGNAATVHVGAARSAAAGPGACVTPLVLTLQPGQHFPGGTSQTLPSDLPPGPVSLQLPVYDGAVPTQEGEKLPSFTVPGVDYMKSASTTYRTPDGIETVQTWYLAAFKACGYTTFDSQTSEHNGVQVSQGISFTATRSGLNTRISLSFAASDIGGTLILYVAIVITPPQYPVAGSILRVPGEPVELRITQYRGVHSGVGDPRPIRYVDIRDPVVATSLADEINHLPKLLGVTYCPVDDGSHDAVVFRDADGSVHPVYVGLLGCRSVNAPKAPSGSAGADPQLQPRIDALLHSPGSAVPPFPFDARGLPVRAVRQLGGTPGQFLSTGIDKSRLLYLSHGSLFMVGAAHGSPRLLGTGITDATFDKRDMYVLARKSSTRGASRLFLINTSTRRSIPFQLPSGSVLLGRIAGPHRAGLSDALACGSFYVWFVRARRVEAIDLSLPVHHRFRMAGFLPPHLNTRQMAISCSGNQIAAVEPGKGLVVHNVGSTQIEAGRAQSRVPAKGVTFFAWAPDDRHLAYRANRTLLVLDVRTGRVHPILHVGTDRILGAAWDPWSRVLALSLTPSGVRPSASHIVLVNSDGKHAGRLSLPFNGSSTLRWSVWNGQTLGVTRVTSRGTQAWAVRLSPPVDPTQGLVG